MRKFHFRKVRRWMRAIMGKGNTEHLNWAFQEGLQLGENVQFTDVPNFGSEPYLIKIGNNVLVSFDVAFVTHDASVWTLKHINKIGKEQGLFGPIVIGDNCFIGCRSTILSNVHIGNNVIIGAGSVVNRDIPSNSIAAGVPCRVLCTIDEYVKKHMSDFISFDDLSKEERVKYLKDHFANEFK